MRRPKPGSWKNLQKPLEYAHLAIRHGPEERLHVGHAILFHGLRPMAA
jgi:hypothetical protein